MVLLISMLTLLCCGCAVDCVLIESLPPDDTKVVIGDSIMTFHGEVCAGVPGALSLITKGYITSGAVGGARMSGGCVSQIPDQYEEVREALPNLLVVILDGGLNDVIKECESPSNCSTGTTVQEMGDLLQLISDDGMTSILVGYYHLIGQWEEWNQVVDVLNDRFEQLETAFVDTRPFFSHPSLYAWDGIHPSEEGSQLIAQLIEEEVQSWQWLVSF